MNESLKDNGSLKDFVGDFAGLYIHFPFCKSKCSYCAFYSFANLNFYNKYINKMISDLSLLPNDFIYDTIYFGGGTPSLIKVDDLGKILSSIKQNRVNEITFEANPESINKNYLNSINKLGVNRLSVGIQSLDDKILKFLGRTHSVKDSFCALDSIKSIYENFSVDFIIGINEYSTKNYVRDIKRIIEIYSPKHFSVYGLSVEEKTKLFSDGYILNQDKFFDDYIAVSQVLKDYGYLHYEVSNFAKKGYYSKHNSKYWFLNDYLGFGPTAHSYYSNKRFNFGNMNSYLNNSLNNIIDSEIDLELSISDIEYEKNMLSIRTMDGLSIKSVSNVEKIEEYENLGLIFIRNEHIIPTDKGFALLNNLINNLIG